MKKVNIIICILLLVFIIFNFNTLKNIGEDFIYFNKANENYVSKAYNMDITCKKRIGHDFVFYGKDNESNEYAYVLFVFRKGIYKVYENEGISKEEAIQVFKKYGKDAALDDICINVWGSFIKGKDIINYLYYFIENEHGYMRYRVNFVDGVFYNVE